MKKFITVFSFFVLVQTSNAAHLVGGEITYTCIGNNLYTIRLVVYRDCNSTGAQLDPTSSIGIYDGIQPTLLHNLSVNKGPTIPVPSSTGNPCLQAPPNICTEYAVYTTTITLPARANGYVITYQRCCRSATISNIPTPDDWGSTLVARIPPNDQCNRSPQWNSLPPIVLCNQELLSIPSSATDPNGDSLHYSLCSPLHGGGKGNGSGFNSPMPNPPAPPPYTTIGFLNPATASNPIPGNPSLSINGATGTLTGRPAVPGQFVLTICVEEWRNGAFLNTIRRDYQFYVTNCSGPTITNPQNFTAYSGTGWANFKCKSSDNTATYQWQQSSGAGWSNLSNLGNYTGATSDSLVIIGVTSTMNNYGYRCIVASCTTDTSDVAVLTVANGIGLGESSLQKLTVSPNPTNGIVSLNTSVVGTFELRTLDGRVLESGTAKKEYDLSVYPNGVYNLRLTTNEGTRVLKILRI